MAFFEMHYSSRTLAMQVAVNVIIPDRKTAYGEEDKPYKTLYLLHGLSDDYSIWMRRTSIERYANEHGIAVVMPSVTRSWYSNTAYGAKYFSFVAEELPALCRSYFKGMSDAREDNLVAGLSMGGYGALKIALTFPERFGGCASLSGAMGFPHHSSRPMNAEWKGNFGFEMENFSEIAGTENDVHFLAKEALAKGAEMPKIYLWCGTEDFLIKDNRDYRDLLTELGIEHLYEESEGDHSWKWWDLHIQSALNYLLDK